MQTKAVPKRRIRARGAKRFSRSRWGDAVLVLLIGAMAAFMALPLVYTISTAFKPIEELFLFPPRFFPSNPTLRNFADMVIALQSSFVPFTRYLFNSVLITLVSTAAHVLLSALCAYPLAKHQFRFRGFIFNVIVLSLMFSPFVVGIPRFMLMSRLGMINNYSALILPAVGSTLGLYLLKQFMEQIPDSVLESARIDGSGEVRILFHIVLPMVRPAWLTLIVLMVNQTWNDSYSATLYVHNEAMKPISLVQQYLVADGFVRAGATAALALLLLLPPIVTFVVSQSNVIETMKSSGMKD